MVLDRGRTSKLRGAALFCHVPPLGYPHRVHWPGTGGEVTESRTVRLAGACDAIRRR